MTDKAAIAKLLDEVKWEAIPEPTYMNPGELYATHFGHIEINGLSLRVHQLSDGTRVITTESIAKLFGVE